MSAKESYLNFEFENYSSINLGVFLSTRICNDQQYFNGTLHTHLLYRTLVTKQPKVVTFTAMTFAHILC